jgi:hypothetical protein
MSPQLNNGIQWQLLLVLALFCSAAPVHWFESKSKGRGGNTEGAATELHHTTMVSPLLKHKSSGAPPASRAIGTALLHKRPFHGNLKWHDPVEIGKLFFLYSTARLTGW